MNRFMMELFPTPESPSIRMRSETLGSAAAAIAELRLQRRHGLGGGAEARRRLDRARGLPMPSPGEQPLSVCARAARTTAARRTHGNTFLVRTALPREHRRKLATWGEVALPAAPQRTVLRPDG